MRCVFSRLAIITSKKAKLDTLPIVLLFAYVPCADSEGGGGGQALAPLKNRKNKAFLSNSRPDPIKNLSSQHSMFGQHRHASETPFKWRFACGPMMARL